MKNILIIALVIFMIFPLCSCTHPISNEAETESPIVLQTVSSTPAVDAVSSASLDTLQSPTPTADVTPAPIVFYEESPDDLVIIADSEGVILYGYAKGDWITHTEATRYFKKGMTFYQYNIEGLVRRLTTIDLTENPAFYELSGLKSSDKDDYGKHYAMGFEGNPEIIYRTIITNVSPDKLPKTTDVKNSSTIKSRVQSYLDFAFGENTPSVNIISATQIDLDNDGKDEIIVNANNYTWDENDKPWYSLIFIIKPDNSIYLLLEDSFIDIDPSELNFCSFYLFYDFNSDGNCEFLLDEHSYECYSINIFTYNGYYESQVLYTGACS